MTDVFLRKYSLTISNNTEVIEKIKQEPIISPVFVGGVSPKRATTNPEDVLTVAAGTNNREYTDLHFEAEIEYGSKKKKNATQDATIKIYNLSEDSQKFIKKHYFVFLKAGYSEDKELPLIFSGQIIKVSTEKSGNDVITKLLCQDNGIPSGNIRECLSYARGMTYLDIIQDMLNRLANKGIPTGHFIFNPPFRNDKIIRKVESGYVSFGYLVKEIMELCEAIDYRAYILLGKIYVEPISLPETVGVVEISEDDIKGSIRPEDDGSSKKLGSTEQTSGIKVDLFLNGNISPERFVKVLEGPYAGTYKVTEVKHRLSFEGNSWDTEISCTKG